MKKTKSFISIITGILVFFLASSAFVLSYDALYQLAFANGITPKLAWLWPLTLDAVMIAASLTVLRQSLSNERAWYGWLIVGLFTALSVIFNVIHAQNTWLSRAIFTLPPVVCFLSFELLVSQVRSVIKRSSTAMSLKQIEEAISRSQDEILELEQHADTLSEQIATKEQHLATEIQQVAREDQNRINELQQIVDELQSQATRLLSENRALQNTAQTAQQEYNELKKILENDIDVAKTSQRLKELYSIQSDLNSTVAAKIVGTSRQAVDAQIKRMIDRGEMKKNGTGYIILESER